MLPPDNIDDLFRQQLDGHATPPAPDLWARLQLPDAAPVDATFQNGLRGHATPPRRELWERLEDEHLRPQPRRRRAVAWWQLSAAAVLLLVLVGGALWGSLWQAPTGGAVASHNSGTGPAAGTTAAGPTATEATHATAQAPEAVATQAQELATNQPTPATSEKNQEIFAPQATAPRPSTSSTPIASTTRPRRPATAPRVSAGSQTKRSQPDAAASTLARSGGRKTPAGQAVSNSPQPTAPVLAPATHDNNAPALAVAAPAVAPATPEVIEVEVRRGGSHPAPAVVAVAAVEATPVAPTRRRGLRLGGLLRQADHLVHGESVNLAEATGLPETVTVQARLGGRLLSKTIQL